MKYPLNRDGIRRIETMCRSRVMNLQKTLAREAADYLLRFGYHALWPSGPYDSSPGWSWYYAANWNFTIGSVDSGVIQPERDPFDEEAEAYQGDYYDKLESLNGNPFGEAKFGEMLYVTNSVYYGKWLNDGGVEFMTHLNESHPNRFIELCEAHLKDILPGAIKLAKEEREL